MEITTQVRPATPADIPAMLPMINAAFSVETFLNGDRTNAETLAKHMQSDQFLLAEDAAGVIHASVLIELHGDTAYFGMLAVDPSRKGRGLGRTMIGAAEDFARERGATRMDITVLSLRPELLPYYRKLGYVENGTKPFEAEHGRRVAEPCHCICMSKLL